MSTVFLYLFLLLCLGLIIRVIAKPILIFEYPYFIAGIFLIFLVPQAIILTNQPRLIPDGTLAPVICQCFLCLLMAVVGYYIAPSIRIGKYLDFPLYIPKLRLIAFVYTFLGYLFLYLINKNLAEADKVVTQWTGILTIYYQFFQVINVAFPIFLFLAFKKPNLINITGVVLSALPSLQLIIFAGRREPTALFVLSVALALYYRYKVVPPRAVIAGAFIFAMLIMPAIGDYRAIASQKGPVEALQELDLQKTFVNYFNEGEHLELAVAANIIDSYSFTGNYTYGATYWDYMVFRYIPAQILGSKFKQSLYILNKPVVFRNGYVMYPGLTHTGVGDSFMQFGYFGCLFFFFLGGLFRNLYMYSTLNDRPLVQILYIVSVVSGMLTVTHATVNFLPGIFFNFVCLYGASVYARVDTE